MAYQRIANGFPNTFNAFLNASNRSIKKAPMVCNFFPTVHEFMKIFPMLFPALSTGRKAAVSTVHVDSQRFSTLSALCSYFSIRESQQCSVRNEQT